MYKEVFVTYITSIMIILISLGGDFHFKSYMYSFQNVFIIVQNKCVWLGTSAVVTSMTLIILESVLYILEQGCFLYRGSESLAYSVLRVAQVSYE